jgi:hypothetical protein
MPIFGFFFVAGSRNPLDIGKLALLTRRSVRLQSIGSVSKTMSLSEEDNVLV